MVRLDVIFVVVILLLLDFLYFDYCLLWCCWLGNLIFGLSIFVVCVYDKIVIVLIVVLVFVVMFESVFEFLYVVWVWLW